ncbi:4587_t:CDS:1 [Acaulospora colombiana]|uniref:4587_t:CDS:1 n=1 Tax=Acaulospora colombiana TaxID=27376 RepID=A0ACA9KAT2_9GLOM|nr:4587_t:CDS:1 [Acaulospora colombiana]
MAAHPAVQSVLMIMVNQNLSLFYNYDLLGELINARYRRGRTNYRETGFRLFAEVFEDKYTKVLSGQYMQRQKPSIIRKASEVYWRNMPQIERQRYSEYASDLNAENSKRRFRPSNFSINMEQFVLTLFDGASSISDQHESNRKEDEINQQQNF